MRKADETAVNFIDGIKRTLCGLPELSLKVLQPQETCVIVVDMINGFVNDGALASPFIKEINQDIANFASIARGKGIDVYALADTHTEQSPEFTGYPVHCLAGTDECLLTPELNDAGNITVIKKNSTNGFLEDEFKKKIFNKGYTAYIVVGCCTDICVQQLALTLKAEFNRENKIARVIVPSSLTATYDAPEHNRELCSLFALYNMSINGIEIVKKVI